MFCLDCQEWNGKVYELGNIKMSMTLFGKGFLLVCISSGFWFNVNITYGQTELANTDFFLKPVVKVKCVSGGFKNNII